MIIGYVIKASRRDDLGCFRWFGCEISSFSFRGFKNVVSSAGSCRSFLQKQKVWFLFASLEVSLPAALQKKESLRSDDSVSGPSVEMIRLALCVNDGERCGYGAALPV